MDHRRRGLKEFVLNLPRLTITSTLTWSLAAIVVLALLLFSSLPALLSAAIGNGGGDLDVAAALEEYMAEADESMQLYQARFNGRSAFYTPLPTPRPQPPRPPVIERPEPERPTTPVTQPIPTRYTGPSIMAIYGDEVWFTGSGFTNEILRVKVGEVKQGIEVVATDPPWSATLKYQRGEYTVPLFELNERLFAAEDLDATPPPGLEEEPPPPADEPAKTDTPDDPGPTAPKSPPDPADKNDERSSNPGRQSSQDAKAASGRVEEEESESPPGRVP